MSEPTFEIVFRGKLLRDFNRDTVRRNLAALFKTDEARIDAMLDQPRVVLKRGLDKDAAQRYQELLRQAGIMVAAVMEPGSTAAPAPGTLRSSTADPPSRPADPAPPAATSGLSIAPVGSLILEGTPKPAARQYDLSKFKLDAAGATLVEAAKPPPARIDTSLLELAPVEAEPERPISALDKLLGEG